ncbi:MAG: hypothetical protein FJ290_31795 [Planctomycetes bacterium]|nr:hypothetical protein [Planctomycetota bacterium]
MTAAERRAALAARKACRHPWHGPPHEDYGEGSYHLTAACYEHEHFIGHTPERMARFEADLLDLLHAHSKTVWAWCVLPNHYHALTETGEIKTLLAALGMLHGRSSFQWNGQENTRGRQVWHRCEERAIRSERHFWATMNYVHHNPVHHGYVKRWEEWPYASARDFIQWVGREEAKRIWRAYPLLDYGKGWDDPRL